MDMLLYRSRGKQPRLLHSQGDSVLDTSFLEQYLSEVQGQMTRTKQIAENAEDRIHELASLQEEAESVVEDGQTLIDALHRLIDGLDSLEHIVEQAMEIEYGADDLGVPN